jgi:uncharacterized protein YndB with AHSA1/START domain
MTDSGDGPRVEVTIAAPADTVWRALRDPQSLRRWHGWEFDGLDEEIEGIFLTGVVEDAAAHVLEVPGGDRFSLHGDGDGDGGGTVLRLTRSPIGSDPEWDAYYDDITEGWYTFLHQLRFAIERHGLAERRTVYIEGTLEQPGVLVDALGLHEVAALPPGSPYKAETAAGGELSGRIWAVSPRQLLLTVDQFGDGLAVLAQQPHAPHRPEGGVQALLTIYGMDDGAFAGVESRWRSWWERHRVAPEDEDIELEPPPARL